MLFYIANEGLSILENLAVVDVLVPVNIAKKLKQINDSGQSLKDEVKEEMSDKD